MWIENVNISPLLKAFKKFESFRVNQNTEQEKAGIVQAFEYCFELSWKMMKRILSERGIDDVYSPREVFRQAIAEGLIDDEEIWFDFLRKRNATSHTYEEFNMEEVLKICPLFSSEVSKFLKQIGVSDVEN